MFGWCDSAESRVKSLQRSTQSVRVSQISRVLCVLRGERCLRFAGKPHRGHDGLIRGSQLFIHGPEVLIGGLGPTDLESIAQPFGVFS